MTVARQFGGLLLAGGIGLCVLELGNGLSIPRFPALVSTAEAIVGRPLTPVSVAGVARRSARHCAVGVYYC
jgi:hypothetical protein